jgi:glyoxylase-like metal-dependent hydrolase (beta-lactamase superfamily II)
MAAQPVLVDTGMAPSREAFLAALGEVVDPADLRWIWLTHPDRDHTGSLYELLELAPQARLVTTFLGAGILSIERPVPPERMYLLNPGQSLDVGDRTLTAFRPPVFDSPATTGFVDDKTGTVYSSDCFGAPVATPELAAAADVTAVPASDLAAGQLLWTAVDSPWVHGVDRAAFARALEPLRALDPPMVLSTHLPPALGRAREFLDRLATAPDADPFVGPDQAAIEAMFAELEAASVPAAREPESSPTVTA